MAACFGAVTSGRNIFWRSFEFKAISFAKDAHFLRNYQNTVQSVVYSSTLQWRVRAIGSGALQWKADECPYDILELERDSDEEKIKAAYRKMAKQYHPDAYELLMDTEARRNYDLDNTSNPMRASKAWMEWLMKRKQAFEQRGDMAAAFWAQQQNREMNIKARQLSKHKVDLGEEKQILARSKQLSAAHVETTMKRHTLVLKKRDIIRRRAEEQRAREQLVQKLLAAEGLEVEEEHGSQQE